MTSKVDQSRWRRHNALGHVTFY